jgi:hypothetical protein
MIELLEKLAASHPLSPDAASVLKERGFVVLSGPFPAMQMVRLTEAYTSAMSSAAGPDVKIGSTTTRVTDFVNRGPEFDELYLFPPLLDACFQVIGRPFKLSSLQARTLRPKTPGQALHVDVRRDSADWPLLGFVLMIDEFLTENGATCFVSGSHQWLCSPEDRASGNVAQAVDRQSACGPAGSLLIFNGSVWHGHGANTSEKPRRSLQGAFVPRDGQAATDFAVRMQPETRARLSALARFVLAA